METLPEEIIVEEQPQEQEPPMEFSPEIEAVRAKRPGIMQRALGNKTADMIGNLIPGIDVPKMLTEAAYGKTISGKELSGREQIDYVVIAGMVSFAYALQMMGMPHEAIATKSFGMMFAGIELGPDIISDAVHLAKDKMPHLVPYLEKTAAFLSDKQPLIEEAARNIRNFITSNPVFVLLNLH